MSEDLHACVEIAALVGRRRPVADRHGARRFAAGAAAAQHLERLYLAVGAATSARSGSAGPRSPPGTETKALEQPGRGRRPAVAVRLGPEDERRPARRPLAAAAAPGDRVDAGDGGAGRRPSCVLALGLPLGAAILLGGILAPTDPVLASDVQVAEPGDRDRLRFALTGEAGLNDGTAFPSFCCSASALLGLHEIGSGGWRWLAVRRALGGKRRRGHRRDPRHRRRPARALPAPNPQGSRRPRQLPRLGLVGLAYGAASYWRMHVRLSRRVRRRRRLAPARLEQHASTRAGGGAPASARGKGAARRRRSAEVARREACSADPDASHAEQVATDPKRSALAFMAHAMLAFNEQIERIGPRSPAEVIAVRGCCSGRSSGGSPRGLRRRAAARDPADVSR